MMKKNLIAFAGLLLFMAFGQFAFAQNNDWQGGYLRADGFNEIDGLEVFYKKVDCNGEQFVIIKMINNNDYALDITWYNDIMTKDFTWIKRQDDGSVASEVEVPANSTLEGSCSSNYVQLRFSLEEVLGDDSDEFKYARFADYTIEKVD